MAIGGLLLLYFTCFPILGLRLMTIHRKEKKFINHISDKRLICRLYKELP